MGLGSEINKTRVFAAMSSAITKVTCRAETINRAKYLERSHLCGSSMFGGPATLLSAGSVTSRLPDGSRTSFVSLSAAQIAESVMRLPGRYLSIKDIQNVALNQRDVLRVNSPTGCHLSGLQSCGVGSRERSGYHGDNEDVGSRRI